MRADGVLMPIANEQNLTAEDAEGLVGAILTSDQKAKFVAEKEMDLAYDYLGKARFRVNVYFQKGYMSAALRLIPAKS